MSPSAEEPLEVTVIIDREPGTFHAIAWERRDGHLIASGRWRADGPVVWRSWPADRVELTEVGDTEIPYERYLKLRAAGLPVSHASGDWQ